MRPGYVESDEEYKISKVLLLQFICSAAVLQAADSRMHIVICILRFLQSHVFIYEDLYLHFKHKHVRHFDVAHGSQHEVYYFYILFSCQKMVVLSLTHIYSLLVFQGTNFGLKSHSSSLKPTQGMDTSAQTLNLQADIKAGQMDEIIFNDYQNNNKMWSDWPTSPYTTTFAEGLINTVYNRHHLYTVWRVAERTFQVEFTHVAGTIEVENDDIMNFRHIPIPLFKRVREVTVDDIGIMFCTCKRFECRGIFCEQQVCSAEAIYAHALVQNLWDSIIMMLPLGTWRRSCTWLTERRRRLTFRPHLII